MIGQAQHIPRAARLPMLPAKGQTAAQRREWKSGLASTLYETRDPSSGLYESARYIYAKVNAPHVLKAAKPESKTKEYSAEMTKIGPAGLTISAGTDEIAAAAETKSKRMELAFSRILKQNIDGYKEAAADSDDAALAFMVAISHGIYDELASLVFMTGIEPPQIKKNGPILGAISRMQCAKWWRRKLRTAHGRFKENEAIKIGMIRKGRALYVSDDTLEDRKTQKSRNADLLGSLIAVCDEFEQAMCLADIAEASVSNESIRRMETMTRLRGIEEWATDCGMDAHFWTITVPSRFHRWRKNKVTGIYEQNPKWDGSTPRDAHAYMVNLWARIRAAFQRAELGVAYFRVSEPHHCGCPHWHVLAFADSVQIEQATAIVKDYALRDNPAESGAQKHRFTVERIDSEKGSAVGYVAKYLAKNLDGQGVAGAEARDNKDSKHGITVDDAIRRVDAWRGVWGIRQFQFGTSGSVSVWRELRRLKEKPAGPIAPAWETAQGKDEGNPDKRADWCAFLKELEAAPVSIVWQVAELPGIYGEKVRSIIGLSCGGTDYETRPLDWHLMEKRDAQKIEWIKKQIDQRAAAAENAVLSPLGLVSITVPTGTGGDEQTAVKPPYHRERGKP